MIIVTALTSLLLAASSDDSDADALISIEKLRRVDPLDQVRVTPPAPDRIADDG